MKEYHVLPGRNDSWKAVTAESKEVIAEAETREKVMEILTKTTGDNEPIKVLVFNEDGALQSEFYSW